MGLNRNKKYSKVSSHEEVNPILKKQDDRRPLFKAPKEEMFFCMKNKKVKNELQGVGNGTEICKFVNEVVKPMQKARDGENKEEHSFLIEQREEKVSKKEPNIFETVNEADKLKQKAQDGENEEEHSFLIEQREEKFSKKEPETKCPEKTKPKFSLKRISRKKVFNSFKKLMK